MHGKINLGVPSGACLSFFSARRPVELKRGIDEMITVRWAFKNYSEGNVMAILDPLLNEAVDGEVVMKMLSLAFECPAPTRADRPAMEEVGERLREIKKRLWKKTLRVKQLRLNLFTNFFQQEDMPDFNYV